VELSSWEAAAIAAKALTYTFGLSAAGGAIFVLLFSPLLRAEERARIVRVTVSLAVAAIIFTALRLPILAATLGGDMSSMADMSLLRFALESSEGQSALVRTSGLIFVLALAAPSFAGSVIATLGAIVVAASFAFTGHSLSLERGVLPQALVTVHLLGISYWLGAFYPLRSIAYRSDPPGVARIMKRFGDIAVYVVAVLFAAGFVLLWIFLESPLALFESDYGRALAIKLLFVAGLLGLATVNRFVLTPALLHGDISALPRLRNSITVELLLAALILVMTAGLTTVTGPPALE
jgi:putative copper resistance protein D